MPSRRYAALLRAVNVGGHKLAMADLRALCEELGCTDVVTYVQSGNVVVTSTLSAAALERDLSAALGAHAGYDIPVIVREHKALVKVVEGNPYPDTETRFVHVGFLDKTPTKAAVAELSDVEVSPEGFTIAGAEIYLNYVNGAGRSQKLGKVRFERRLGVVMTARNLNTVAKLVELSEP